MIDDDPDITYNFRLILESAGFNVDTYNDPIALLRVYNPKQYDLLLIDIRMPKLNGFKLYQKLKKIDFNIRVCFVTSFEPYYNSLTEQFSLDVGCFIRKPLSKDELIEHVLKKLAS